VLLLDSACRIFGEHQDLLAVAKLHACAYRDSGTQGHGMHGLAVGRDHTVPQADQVHHVVC
jgi:hypothetical protein